MRLLAIDPGVRFVGWARFHAHPSPRGFLLACGVLKRPKLLPVHELAEWYGDELQATIGGWDAPVAAERMESYPGSSTPANDLIDIAYIGGYLAGRFGAGRGVTFHFPKDWKGGISKAVTEARVRKAFQNTGELATLDEQLSAYPKDQWEHAIDAVGIGLARLGRMKRGVIT
jgi:hypothetical protein